MFDQFCKAASATNLGTIELIGHFGSLDLVGLANPGGDGFYVGNANLGPIAAGPEPTSWLFTTLGLGLVGAALRCRPSPAGTMVAATTA